MEQERVLKKSKNGSELHPEIHPSDVPRRSRLELFLMLKGMSVYKVCKRTGCKAASIRRFIKKGYGSLPVMMSVAFELDMGDYRDLIGFM